MFTGKVFLKRPALLASFAWLVLFTGLIVGCSEAPPDAIRLAGATMGTTYHITIVPAKAMDESSVAQLQKEVDSHLLLINQQMSTYIPDSELNRLQARPVGGWTELSAELARVLSISHEISELSGGAFDITVRPLVDMWGFGPEPALDKVPSPDSVAHARSQVDFRAIELEGNSCRLLKPVHIDLSAVAKGFGVDEIANLLTAKGFTNHMVEIGGELRLTGLNPKGQPWRIAIEKPQTELVQTVQRAISLTNVGMATSGDYRNYFEQDGVRYSHTVDPRTGYPIQHNLASVTVLHPSSAYADALATAFDVLGAEEARRLADSQGIAAFFIIKTPDGFQEIASEAFKPYLHAQ